MEKRTDMRAEALDTLIDIERNKKLSHIAIGETLMRTSLKKRQTGFYTRLCEGVTERKIYLDYILDHYSKTPMKKCKPLIRSLLRMGAYQILFMDVRDAAACSEAVSLAKKRGFGRLSGFVNGVLRTLVREKETFRYLRGTFKAGDQLNPVLLFNLPDGDPAYDDGQNAGGNIAHGHDDSGADISKVRELLQTPQYRHTKDKYTAEIDDKGNPCLAKSVKQSHNSRIDTKGNGS